MNFFTPSSSVSIVDLEQVNVNWSISKENQEIKLNQIKEIKYGHNSSTCNLMYNKNFTNIFSYNFVFVNPTTFQLSPLFLARRQ